VESITTIHTGADASVIVALTFSMPSFDRSAVRGFVFVMISSFGTFALHFH
jgi:hypothetical protein